VFRGEGEAPPPEAATRLVFGRSMEAANLPTFVKFRNAQNQILFVLSLQKMKLSRLQYVTDYCALMKTNRLVSIFGKLFTCLFILNF